MDALLVIPQDGSMVELSTGESFDSGRILARIQPPETGIVGVDLVQDDAQKAYLMFPLRGPVNSRASEVVHRLTGAYMDVTGDAAFILSLEDAATLLHQRFKYGWNVCPACALGNHGPGSCQSPLSQCDCADAGHPAATDGDTP